MDPWLLVVLMGLATWRLSRLVTKDEFPPVRWARDKIVDKGPEWLGDLVTCLRWCTPVYVAAGVVALTDIFSSVPVPLPLLTFGAVAALASILAVLVERWEGSDEPDEQPEQLELETESEMATMVTLERQAAPNSHVSG